MKKLFKILLILIVAAVLLLIGAVITLKQMYPPQKLKLMAQNYVRENFHREVDFSSLSLNLVGVTVKDFKLSERSTFSDGTFVSAKKAVIKLELAPLFEKRIVINTLGFDGLNVNVIKNADGKFNFDDFINAGPQAAQKAEETNNKDNAPLDLVADNIYLKNSSVNYTDKMSGSSFVVKHVNIFADGFDFVKDFSFNASFLTDIKTSSLSLPAVKIDFAGTANLASMEIADAYLKLQNFTLSYKTAALNMQGSLNNFSNPEVVLSGALTGIDSNLLSQFLKGSSTVFTLPQIDIQSNTSTDIEHGATKINNIKISLGNSYIITDGNLDYSTPQFKYNTFTRISVSLGEVGQIARDMLGKYNLTGTLSGTAEALSGAKEPVIKGTLNFDGIGANINGKEIKNVSGSLTVNSLKNIKTNLITGFFAGSAFKTSLAYLKSGRTHDINFFFDMDKFTLDDVNFDALMSKDKNKHAAPQPKKAGTEVKTVTVAPRSAPFNIKADIFVRKIANNVFNTDNFTLKADVKNFDNIMDRAKGTISFSSVNGEIKDLDKLMSSSVVARVLFTSVRIVQKALNFIKMDKLSIGVNTVTYKNVEGIYTLNDGIITINKSEIDSDLTTVKALGTINLISEALDMKIESHMGKVTSSGFKPVVIKVGGTLSDPSYKLDVVSTVTSVVSLPGAIVKGGVHVSTGIVKGVAVGTGEIVKGAAGGTADIVKGVAGGIGGLFKKKKNQEEDGGK